jgi:phytoene synthase
VSAVDAAYAQVARITRARARNFAWGIMVLPKEKRQAISAIYAFAREVDDVADGELPAEEKRARLQQMHRKLHGGGAEPMWVALADARARFQIPAQPLHDLVDGGLIDLDKERYTTFGELREYCAHVAGAVGVACVAVYGAADERERAETLGIALQLINIMRDVREDWELGRVYLPQDELARFGVTEDAIAVGRVTAEWTALMRFQADRARSYLSEGLTLLSHLDRRSAACVATFARLYEATLERIEAVGFDVFEGPPRLPPLQKVRIVGRALLG